MSEYDWLIVALREYAEKQREQLVYEAADAIEELSKPRWIPVTERLPIGGDDSGAICENVCLSMDDGTVSCGWMNDITKKVYYLNARDDFVIKAPITRVTHWMPLPEPPKGGSMRKTFCDHCGKEITGIDINELGTNDCFFDVPNRDFVGCGYTLCEECWDERINAHIQLDKIFLKIVEV